MKKIARSNLVTCFTLSLALTPSAHAALSNGSVLMLDDGQAFQFEVSPGFFVDIPIIQVIEGIRLGESQLASGSHTGFIDGTENPSIDLWHFMGNTGMHYTRSPTNVLSASGNTALIDFSGWAIGFNSVEPIDMSTGAWGGNPDGVAQVTCDLDCSTGDRFSLYYSATVPLDDPSGFGGVVYQYNVQGTISAVPVPAAVWLFGSGLIGLAMMNRRTKT